MKNFVIFLASLSLFVSCGNNPEQVGYYLQQDASRWEEAIPLGNGRLGMLPFGGIAKETIPLNEITLWSGSKEDSDDPEAGKYLPEIRSLLFSGKGKEAQELMQKTFVCKGKGSAGRPYGRYQLFANLELTFEQDQAKAENYRRSINFNSGTSQLTYTLDGTDYTREYFCSMTDDVDVIELSASEKGKISFSATFSRPERYNVRSEGDNLVVEGTLDSGFDDIEGMKYYGVMRIIPQGGELTKNGSSLSVKGADRATILLSLKTDYDNCTEYKSLANDLLARAGKKTFQTLKKTHAKAFSEKFDRVELRLPKNANSSLPIDKRLIAFATDRTDADLAATYMQFGRYLLISSTREGSLPPNLQGLWAPQLDTPWNGDYHININLQMNLWPAEVGNLSELHIPLAEYTASLVEPGSKTAKVYYGTDGWVSHINCNIHGCTSPGFSPSWGATNTCGAWLCAHIWNHYLYSLDKEFLAKYYPVIRGAALFFSQMLVEEPRSGYLVTAPTSSPENSYIDFNGDQLYVCAGSAMDNQIVRELFHNTIAAAEILGLENDSLISDIKEKLPRIAPDKIGKYGQVMEWTEDFEEPDPHHRHVSMLYALYPGTEFTYKGSPDMMEAAKVTLNRRGDPSTGWSMAWKICFWARLRDGDRAYKLIGDLLKPCFSSDFNYSNGGGTYPDVFCAHPPMQIDGNFGGSAGIMEMLIQCHDGEIELIPAIPQEWSEGYARGLCARGGKEVEFSWKNGKVVSQKIIDRK